MIIRTYNENDEHAVIGLWSSCALIVPWNNPSEDIKRKSLVGSDLFLVGDSVGELISTVMGGYDGHRGWINYLAVDPKHQRQGLGRQMMQEVETRIRAKGCPKINLQVRLQNSQSVAFYQAIGFSDDRTISLGKRLVDDGAPASLS